MTDDKGVGEGPYKVKKHKYWWCVDGLGEEDRLNQWAYKLGAEWWADRLNDAYAAGRASHDGLGKVLMDYLEWHKSIADDDGSDMALGAYRAWEKIVKEALEADGDDE